MKTKIALHAVIRLMSIMSIPIVFVICVVSRGENAQEWFVLDSAFNAFVCANVILAMYPDCIQDVGRSVLFAAGSLVLTALVCSLNWTVGITMVYLCIYVITNMSLRQRSPDAPLQNAMLWSLFESYAMMYYRFILLLIYVLYVSFVSAWARIPVLVCAVLLYAARYISAYTGWTMLLDHKRELMIKRLICGLVDGNSPTHSENENDMSAIFKRIEDYFEKERPYLDQNFHLDNLVAETFSNRSYVSRVIRHYTSMNFSQFVNRFRVMYSIGLMEENPNIRVSELAFRSGFNSTVSYNLAFKLNMHDTPANYCREHFFN